MDYQAEKGDVATDADKIELNHLSDVRMVKDKIIETEVEIRKQKADCEKEKDNIGKDQSTQLTKQGEYQVQKKQIEQERVNFKKDSETVERDLKIKLNQVTDNMKE